MYIPRHHEEHDPSTLHALVQAHPLATWVTQGEDELIANHIPFLLDPTRGPHGTLMGHVARANPVWQMYSKTVKSVLVFQGEEAYISPSWYPSKAVHGKGVPTWNYAVVHAHGHPVVIEDAAWLTKHLRQMSDTYEAGQALPWKLSDAPQDYIALLMKAIVGIEIPIEKLVGKWKVSQNRPEADKRGVIAGLMASDDARAKAMAGLVEKYARQVEAKS